MYEQPNKTSSCNKSNGKYRKNRTGRQNDHNIYRQPSYIGRCQQKHKPLMSDWSNKEKKGAELGMTNREIQLCCNKATVGIQGNVMANTLAKQGKTNMDLAKNYRKIPKSAEITELTERNVKTWQRQWDQTTKGAVTKQYFPMVKQRLMMNIKITPNPMTIITGHGNIRSYIHRFKLTHTPTVLVAKVLKQPTIYHTTVRY